MFDTKSVSIDWAGRKLTLETGRVARQADGAVFATWGETALLATVVFAKEAKPGQDFFPLTVNYQEKYFASGRIPGGFFKREGRPTERETLLSRLIDRPIRPLFVDGFKNEVQVIITVLRWDNENESDLLAMVAASAALTISGVPFMGPIAASPRRLDRRQADAQPDHRADEDERTRSRRRRHRQRDHDGRVRSEGTHRSADARKRCSSATRACSR